MKKYRKSSKSLWKGQKNVKSLVLILIVAISISIGGYLAIDAYIEAMSPTWQADAAQTRTIEAQRAQIELEKQAKESPIDYKFWTFFVILCGAGAVITVYTHKHYIIAKTYPYLAQNGVYALQQVKTEQGIVFLDPNKMIGNASAVTHSGQVFNQFVDVNAQLAQNQLAQQSRNLNALGNHDNQIRASVMGKILGQQPRQISTIEQNETVIEEQQLLEIAQIPYSEAFARSTEDSWLIGQNVSGEFATLNMEESPHVALFGATSTGKTSNAAMTILLAALKHGYHCIALDGKMTNEWTRLNAYVEAYKVNSLQMAGIVEQLTVINDTRREILNKLDCDALFELEVSERPFAPIIIFFEEFGAIAETLSLENEKDTTVKRLALLLKTMRSTGMICVFIDQTYNAKAKAIYGNCLNTLAYKMGGQAGAALQAYRLKDLQPKGEFWLKATDEFYKSWHVKPEMSKYYRHFYANPKSLLDSTNDFTLTVKPDEDGGITRVEENSPVKPLPLEKTLTTRVKEDFTVKESSNGIPNTPVKESLTVKEIPNGKTDFNDETPLIGEPTTPEDKAWVLKCYADSGKSYNQTCIKVWGSAGRNYAHLDKVLAEFGMLPEARISKYQGRLM